VNNGVCAKALFFVSSFHIISLWKIYRPTQ